MIAQDSLETWFQIAEPFADYLAGVVKHRELWHGLYARVRLPEDLVSGFVPERPVRLLALSGDWCGDAVNILPVVARLAERLGIELRVLDRDENLELMDQYLTDGRSRSIPVVIVMDDQFEEVGWWGPRPRELQTWRLGEGATLPAATRIREARRWYAKDRGRTTLDEVVRIIASAA